VIHKVIYDLQCKREFNLYPWLCLSFFNWILSNWNGTSCRI